MKFFRALLLAFFLIEPALAQQQQVPQATDDQVQSGADVKRYVNPRQYQEFMGTNGGGSASQAAINSSSNLVYVNATNASGAISHDVSNISSNLVYGTSQIGAQGIANNTSNLLATIFGFGASGFVTLVTNGSPTAVIQSQINGITNGGVLSIQPGTYTITTQLIVTNKPGTVLTIEGNGAKFSYAASLTNFMVDTTTNYGGTLVIDNLVFDGGIYSTYNDSAHFSSLNGIYAPLFNPAWTNRSGLRVEVSGGVRVQNCTFFGWPGNGCLACQKGGSFTSQTTPKFEFLFNRCYTNFIGVFAVSAPYEVPGYFNADSSLWRSGYGAEYALIEGNDTFNNQFGICATAGNALVQGNTINENWFGLAGFGGENCQHGRYCGNTLNHNTIAIYFESSAQSTTGVIQDNMMLANTSIAFNGAEGVIFKYNHIGKASLNFTNGSSGVVLDNITDYTTHWGNSGNPSIDVITNFNPGILVSGNESSDGTNTDFTMLSILRHGTNSVITGAIPYTPDGSNAAWASLSSFTNYFFSHLNFQVASNAFTNIVVGYLQFTNQDGRAFSIPVGTNE